MNAINTAIENVKLQRKKRQKLRKPLMLLGPLVVALLGGWMYFGSGHAVSTDNAYIKAGKVTLSAQVSGPITTIQVRENQAVRAGDMLLQIDPAPYRISLAEADADLADTATEIRALQASYRQKEAELVEARSDLAFAQREVDRQAALLKRNIVAEGNFDAVQHNRDITAQRITVLDQDRSRLLASLAGNPDAPMEAHPKYLSALAKRNAAALNLTRTEVRAPYNGVASKVPQVGQYLSVGSPILSIVSNENFWIEANFKETDIRELRPGQPVDVEVDTYPGADWVATVESIGQASGSEFSVLPAQNATGNWVKVVQRIPVRIALNLKTGQPPLRAGMSATVKVNIAVTR